MAAWAQRTVAWIEAKPERRLKRLRWTFSLSLAAWIGIYALAAAGGNANLMGDGRPPHWPGNLLAALEILALPFLVLSVLGALVPSGADTRRVRRLRESFEPRTHELRLLFGQGRINTVGFDRTAADLGLLAAGTHPAVVSLANARMTTGLAIGALSAATTAAVGLTAGGFGAFFGPYRDTYLFSGMAYDPMLLWPAAAIFSAIALVSAMILPIAWRRARNTRRELEAAIADADRNMDALLREAAGRPSAVTPAKRLPLLATSA